MGGKATTTDHITAARELFSCTALPDTPWLDGGSQFTSKQFQNFSTQWRLKHHMLSTQYPQSNGKAKATVKSMKKTVMQHWMKDSKMMKGCQALVAVSKYTVYMTNKRWTVTSLEALGHPIQGTIPAHPRSFTSELQKCWSRSRREAMQQNAERYYNQTAHLLPDIKQG